MAVLETDRCGPELVAFEAYFRAWLTVRVFQAQEAIRTTVPIRTAEHKRTETRITGITVDLLLKKIKK